MTLAIFRQRYSNRNLEIVLVLFAAALFITIVGQPAAAQTDTFTAGSGVWSLGSNWSLQQPPGQGNDCVIPQNSTVTLDSGGECYNVDVEAGASITAPASGAAYLDVYGPNFVNKGTVSEFSVNGLGFFGNGTQAISGGGTINVLNRGISESFTSTLVNLDNSIHGASGFYITQLTNHALIDANVPSTQLTLQSGTPGITNTRTIQASNGGLLMFSGNSAPPLNNTGGIIQALDGSTVQFGGYALSGGTLTTKGTGVIQNIDSSFFSNFTNNGSFELINGNYAILGGTVVNNGTFSAPNGGFYANGATTLKGSGTVSGLNGALFHGWSNGSTLLLQQPISGGGSIGDSFFALTNQSTITATNPSTPLTLTGNSETNTGTLAASSGGLLEITNTVNNTGGTIEAQDASLVVLDYAGTVEGGTLTTSGAGVVQSWSGTLDGTTNVPTNLGMLDVPGGDSLNVKGTINNNGTISLSSTGSSICLQASSMFAGSGQVLMSPGSWFCSDSSTTLTNESTISGGGNLGLGEMAIVNKGTIVGTQPAPGLQISPDSTGFTNSGTLMTSAGGVLNIQGTFKNFVKNTLSGSGTYMIAGTLEFSNANIVTNAAKITLTGAGAQIIDSGSQANALSHLATNSSLFSLQSGAALSTTVSLTNRGILTVGTGSSLQLGGSFTQTGGTTTVDGAISSPTSFTGKGGKLQGTGNISAAVTADATVIVGDSLSKAGQLSVGSYTQNSTGILDVQIGGTTTGSSYSVLASSNGVQLGGTLNIKRINGFLPTVGETFTVVTGSAVTGQFATVNGLNINASEHFQIDYNPTSVTLTVVSGA